MITGTGHNPQVTNVRHTATPRVRFRLYGHDGKCNNHCWVGGSGGFQGESVVAKLKKWGGYALIGFVLFYLLTQPESAAGVIQGALGGLVGGAESMSRFVNALLP